MRRNVACIQLSQACYVVYAQKDTQVHVQIFMQMHILYSQMCIQIYKERNSRQIYLQKLPEKGSSHILTKMFNLQVQRTQLIYVRYALKPRFKNDIYIHTSVHKAAYQTYLHITWYVRICNKVQTQAHTQVYVQICIEIYTGYIYIPYRLDSHSDAKFVVRNYKP